MRDRQEIMRWAVRIRDARIAKNLSQEALARLAKVSWVSVSRWERAERMPSDRHLKRVKAVLGL